MKKRVACLLLALVMLFSLIPTAAITAYADGADAISEAGIKVIKNYMGFQKNAYETFKDSGVYKIGYGTPAIKGQTITEANADKLLRDELTALNAVVSGAVSVALTQRQFDALVWFAYADQGGSLPSAVVSAVNAKKTGSAFANAICTFDFASGYPDTSASLSVLTRRMAIAGMYLNGTYSAANSGAFGYTVYDAGEGEFSSGVKKMVQVFQITNPVKISVAEPTLTGATFLGWYSDNAMVTGVGSSTAGKVLSARWQKSDMSEVAAAYTLPGYVIYEATHTADTAFVNVVDDPATGNVIDVVKREAVVSIVAEKIVGGAKWLKLSTGGWVKLCNSLGEVPIILNGRNVTITDDYVNIREDPNASSAIVGKAKRGENRTIYMLSSDGKWGYCSEGWIFLAYTSYSDNASSGDVSLTGGVAGTVTGAATVNVRTGPGVYNDIATKLSEGTAIKVYEQTEVNGGAWGHIDQGWIYMAYVKLNQTVQAGTTASTGSTVYVSSSVSLNIRSGPGTEYSKVGALKSGTSVVILQKRTVGGETWGLIDQGWINMNYVSLGTSSGGSSSVSGVGGTVVNCSSGVNIRSAAGTANALVGVAPLGSRVTVTERVKVNGFYWGHIDRGWVCMDYIQLDHEFAEPVVSTGQELDNVVASFEGYPAKTNTATKVEVRETASVHAKSLMALDDNVDINILAMTKSGNNIFGKVTMGSITGWINMGDAYNNGDVILTPLNARISVAKADTYELPNTRSKFYASLLKGTIVTVGKADGSGWELADGVLWGAIEDGGKTAWIKLSDVSKFVGNELPTGITTTSGVGYMTGSVNAETPLYKDSNGNVDTTETIYKVVVGHRVNIQARNYKSGVVYGKITVGSVTGWIPMANVDLDDVKVQATTNLPAWTSAPASVPATANTQISAGTTLTIEDRILVPDTNEINYGIADIGKVYKNNNHSDYYYVRLDQGGLNNLTAAVSADTSNPYVVSGVVVTGTANGELSIYEEAMSSNVLLKIKDGSIVTILNWKNVGGITWGKVQIGNIVGWVKVTDVDLTGMKGTIAVSDLYLYSAPNKASSVQILRENNRVVDVVIDTNSLFDGTTLWGYVDVNGKMGWVDLANLNLQTPGETLSTTPATVIATAKINSVNVTVNANGEIKTLPKGTAVNLTKVEMVGGKAMWTTTFGDVSGEIDMDFLVMNSAVATVITPSIQIMEDLGSMVKMADLYRDEKITVMNFMAWTDGALYGEVAYNNTTGWIQICDASSNMCVSLAPGSTVGSGSTTSGSSTPTDPTSPTVTTSVPGYIVCAKTVNVRSGGGMEYPVVTTLSNGATIRIYEQTTVLGKGWAHIDEGWVCMDYVELGTPPTTITTGSGSVSIMTTVPSGAIAVGFANEDVKIRSGSGLGYPEVSTVKKNNSLVIYEKKLDGGMSWGRTDNGWVCISYLTITGIGTSPNATVSCSYTANVRSNSNSGSALMAKVMVTSRVAVYETVAVGNETWARTDLGWINGQYVVMDSVSSSTPSDVTTPDTTITDSGITEVG